MNKLTREQVLTNRYGLTVKDLLEFVEKHQIPMDAPVLVQRVEDRYYNDNGWGVYLKKGDSWYWASEMNKNMNEEIDRRLAGEEPNYESIENPAEFMSDLEDESIMDQYTPSWSCVKYKDEDNILFIDLHY